MIDGELLFFWPLYAKRRPGCLSNGVAFWTVWRTELTSTCAEQMGADQSLLISKAYDDHSLTSWHANGIDMTSDSKRELNSPTRFARKAYEPAPP